MSIWLISKCQKVQICTFDDNFPNEAKQLYLLKCYLKTPTLSVASEQERERIESTYGRSRFVPPKQYFDRFFPCVCPHLIQFQSYRGRGKVYFQGYL